MTDDRNMARHADVAGDAFLEALFVEGRVAAEVPLPDAFAARLMADAVALMPPVAPARGIMARVRAVLGELGGASGLAGVSAAAVMGVWIGFSGTGVTGDLVSQFWEGAATVSPTVSGWVEVGPLALGGSELLSLISGEGE